MHIIMVMVSIQIEDSLCKIHMNNNILFVDLEKKLQMDKKSKWIDLTIFSTILKGILILLEKKILFRVTKNVLIG
jgi:hypothetical protein